tara:strand:- start:5838 stop:6590 length:753 start_codon:yes stop_codon:yes gene_type:complete
VTDTSPQKPENPWPNLVFNIVLPTLIMLKLSPIPGAEGSPFYAIGPTWAVVLALLFPIGFGIHDYLQKRKVNIFSVLGILLVLLKGTILLLKANTQLIVWIESGMPVLVGIVTLSTAWLKKPLIQRILLNPQVIDQPKLEMGLKENENTGRVRPLMVEVSVIYALLSVFVGFLNFALANHILQSDPKIDEVSAVQEYGKLQVLQFPVIGIPYMVLSIGLLVYTLRKLGKLSGIPALHLMHGYEEAIEEKA